MLHFYRRANLRPVLVFITLIATVTANASLLDCTQALGMELLPGTECIPAEGAVNQVPGSVLKDAIPATPINAALAAFQVDQTRNTSAMSNSAPLLVLMGTLLAILLVRAKRFNTK